MHTRRRPLHNVLGHHDHLLRIQNAARITYYIKVASEACIGISDTRITGIVRSASIKVKNQKKSLTLRTDLLKVGSLTQRLSPTAINFVFQDERRMMHRVSEVMAMGRHTYTPIHRDRNGLTKSISHNYSTIGEHVP